MVNTIATVFEWSTSVRFPWARDKLISCYGSSRVCLWHGYWSSAVSRVIQRKQLPVGNEECNTFVTRWLCIVYTARRWDATTTVPGYTTIPRDILLVYDLFILFLLSVVVHNVKTLLVLCTRQRSLIWLLKVLLEATYYSCWVEDERMAESSSSWICYCVLLGYQLLFISFYSLY